MKPNLPSVELVLPYLKEIDERKFYSNNGPLLRRLEQRYATFLNVDPSQVVVCSNATLALQGSYFLSEGEQILIPDFTFPATALAAEKVGKKIVLRDINIENFNLILSEKDAYENSIYSMVIPFGAEVDLLEVPDFKSVVIDAAASLGSENLDLSLLKKEHTIVFSLHATKVLGIGEGGIAVFGSRERADAMRSYINFGFDGTRNSNILGTNGKMSEIQAAYGHAVLDNWVKEKKDWLKIRNQVQKIEDEFPKFFKQTFKLKCSPYWLSHSNKVLKEEIVKVFEMQGIQTRDWWAQGLHKMRAFSQFKGENFLNTEKVSGELLGLPFYRNMNSKVLDKIYSAFSLLG